MGLSRTDFTNCFWMYDNKNSVLAAYSFFSAYMNLYSNFQCQTSSIKYLGYSSNVIYLKLWGISVDLSHLISDISNYS